MQTPEKLSLIGGSILLVSTLVFTLKSQASNILPKVTSPISNVQDKTSDVQNGNNFSDDFKQAQKSNWQTGTWGTAKFYVDGQDTMHVGSGQLSESYTKVVDINKIRTISLDGSTQAPQDSSFLFANTNRTMSNSTLSTIDHLNRLDTSHTTNMSNMFYGDSSLSGLDVSHFDTHNVINDGMLSMFFGDSSLTSLNVSHFDTSHLTDMWGMFANDSSLRSLDTSHFNTYNSIDTDDMFVNDASLQSLDLTGFNTHWDTNMWGMLANDTSLSNLKLSQDSKLNGNVELPGTYKQGNQALNLDGNAHPGTWVKQ